MSVAIRQVTIRGRVQGVGYRYWVEQQATAHAVEGWVRNRRDGSVEALFAGPEDVVSNMVAACRRGPSSARVDAVDECPGSADALNLRRAGERVSVLPRIWPRRPTERRLGGGRRRHSHPRLLPRAGLGVWFWWSGL